MTLYPCLDDQRPDTRKTLTRLVLRRLPSWVGGFQLTSSPACERELSLATVLRLRFGDQAVAGEKRGAPGQSCPLKPEGGRGHTDRLRSDRREGDQDRELCRLESVRAELGLIHSGQLARLAPCGEAMAAQAKLKVHLVGHCRYVYIHGLWDVKWLVKFLTRS